METLLIAKLLPLGWEFLKGMAYKSGQQTQIYLNEIWKRTWKRKR